MTTVTTRARPETSAGPRRARPRGPQGRTQLAPYVFISPFYVLYTVFLLGPTVFAAWLSLHEWTGIGTPVWVGPDNYARLFADRSFGQSVVNTAWYVGASVFLVIPLALLVSTALNARGLRLREVFRLGYLLPLVLSPVIIALVFSLVFDQEFGLLNAVLRGLFGLAPVDWLGTPLWAKVAITLVIIWRWTGYLVIFFLAGLQNVPRELYEAAAIDGASVLRQFVHVTLPMLRPVTAFVAITVTIGAAQIFEEPFILTQGGPGDASMSVAQFIYRAAFTRQEFGYASAAGFLLFVVVFVITRALAGVLGIGREARR